MYRLTVLLILSLSFNLLFAKDKNTSYHFKYKKGLYYLVNPKGKKVKCEPFTFANRFSEGLALVEKDLKFGYVDSTGKVVIDYQFYDAGPFVEGVAYASKNGKYGYINKTGEFIIGPQFDLAYPFKGEYATVKKMNTDTTVYRNSKMIYTLIKKDGELIGKDFYTSILKMDDYYQATKGDSVFHIKADGTIETVEEEAEKEIVSEFFVVEEMPEYPGGEKGLRQYMAQNIHFPISAQCNSISTRVFVSFVVNKYGDVVDVVPAQPGPPILLQETIRMIETLPKWKAGRHEGKAVSVSYTVPLNFDLN